MALIAKNDGWVGEREIAPAGLTSAVCYNVIDLGYQESKYGIKRQCVILWELAHRMKKGKFKAQRFGLPKFYTLSLNKKANLCKDLQIWRGKAFTKEELAGFDIEKMVGAECTLNIIHETKNETTRAKITAILPKQASAEKMVVENVGSVPEWATEMQAKALDETTAKAMMDKPHDEAVAEESHKEDNLGLPF